MSAGIIVVIVAAVLLLLLVWKSFHAIGAAEVGLVAKRFAFRKLGRGQPHRLPRRSRLPGRAADARPALQALADVLRQEVPVGAGPGRGDRRRHRAGGRSAADRREERGLQAGARNFSDIATFVEHGGQKGVQRPVLPPGTLVPIHPVAFLVHHTADGVRPTRLTGPRRAGQRRCPHAGVVRADTRAAARDGHRTRLPLLDMVGIVTALEGEPLPSGDIASRLGGFADVAAIEESNAVGAPARTDAELIDLLLGSKNNLHNNYQDFQAFLDAGGKIGLQHDPLLYGAYLLNPFLVRVELVPMLVVQPGRGRGDQGLRRPARPPTPPARSSSSARSCAPATAASGRSRCAPASTRSTPACYAAEIVPTSILTLNWAEATSRSPQPGRPPVVDRWPRAARASSSRSTCRCRSTCPTRERRR